jgi:hypothetical protein
VRVHLSQWLPLCLFASEATAAQAGPEQQELSVMLQEHEITAFLNSL